jgi:hypothetical protein
VAYFRFCVKLKSAVSEAIIGALIAALVDINAEKLPHAGHTERKLYMKKSRARVNTSAKTNSANFGIFFI